MLYAALTFWLLVVMFSAWGVHELWCALLKPRIVNSVLLPGTLVAQLGHVLGLLVTGNSVQNTTLMGDDDEGKPQTDKPEKQKIPIIGSVLVGLLPLLACAACLYVAAQYWGGPLLQNLAAGSALSLPQTLPTSLDGAWTMLRGAISLAEGLLSAVLHADLRNLWTIAFLYLAVCLTVRMAPFEGHRRGAIGAIVLAGVLFAVIGALAPAAHDAVLRGWPVLSFTVGALLFLLLVSLVVRGTVGLFRVLAKDE